MSVHVLCRILYSSVQSLSHVRLFVTSWSAACQASLSITNSQNLLRPVRRVDDVIQPSHPLSSPSPAYKSFPALGSFPMSQFFESGGQNIGASASVLPMKVQDWFPLGLTGLISLQSRGLFKSHLQHHSSRVSILKKKKKKKEKKTEISVLQCSAFFIFQLYSCTIIFKAIFPIGDHKCCFHCFLFQCCSGRYCGCLCV